MNPVDRAKNAFDDYDGYEFGMNNTLHSNTISEQTLDVRDKYKFANKICLLRIQAVVGDDSLSDKEKLDQIIAIELGDKAM